MAEILWRQKSRINWLKLGDNNTKYFQAFANNRFRKNFVGPMVMGGNVLVESNQIKQGAVTCFSTMFEKLDWSRSEMGLGLGLWAGLQQIIITR